MTDLRQTRAAARRQLVEREILDAAWSLMAREGVAAVSVREVARSVGLRQQSLTHYYPTKQALLDALFADGFADLRRTLEELPPADDAVGSVVDVAVAVVDYCVANPARYHLMLQRTLPSFAPSEESFRVALGCLNVLVEGSLSGGHHRPRRHRSHSRIDQWAGRRTDCQRPGRPDVRGSSRPWHSHPR